jgi:hypothetical protein
MSEFNSISNPNDLCPLCSHKGDLFYLDHFYLCPECKGIFRSSKYHLSHEQEKSHYQCHNNDVSDLGYQKFANPLAEQIFKHCKSTDLGLDFGAGAAPILSKLLQDQNYTVKQYDPYFHNHPELLTLNYDYIGSCEVIEHFNHPAQEFKLLHELLKTGGSLFCMTHLYNSKIDFKNWYYKNDTTHVFIYQKETCAWIAQHFGFVTTIMSERIIRFEKV